MELELGLALPNHSPMISWGLDLNCNSNGLETENLPNVEDSGVETKTTLPLLLWPEEEYASCPRKWRKIDEDADECEEIEAAPPRRRRRVRKSMHVKVKMEGVGIGRKIDLRHYHSYQAFTNTIIHMFAKYSEIQTKMEDYTLSYQDKEGDWKFVGDVQWGMFVESVQRVEIIKNNNRSVGFRLLSLKS